MDSVEDPVFVRARVLLGRVPRSPSREIRLLVERLNKTLSVCDAALRSARKRVLASPAETFSEKRALLSAELANAMMAPESDEDFVKRARHFDANMSAEACVDRSLSIRRDGEVDALCDIANSRKAFRKAHVGVNAHAEFRHMCALFVAEIEVLGECLLEGLTKHWTREHSIHMAKSILLQARLFLKNEGLMVA